MNKHKRADKAFKIYGLLPHCLLYKWIYKSRMRKRFNKENSDITIIPVNCIGSEIYWILGLKFNSPFINSYINKPDFNRLCLDLKRYLNTTPKYELVGQHVEVKLDDVTIMFYHDDNIEEVKQAFERRLKRINLNKIVVISDDRKGTKQEIDEFDKIPYHKIMLSSKEGKDRVVLSSYKGQKCVGTYNDKSLLGLWKFTYMWDFIPFLNYDFKKEKKSS